MRSPIQMIAPLRSVSSIAHGCSHDELTKIVTSELPVIRSKLKLGVARLTWQTFHRVRFTGFCKNNSREATGKRIQCDSFSVLLSGSTVSRWTFATKTAAAG